MKASEARELAALVINADKDYIFLMSEIETAARKGYKSITYSVPIFQDFIEALKDEGYGIFSTHFGQTPKITISW
jgi:tRNA G26 N,N-dimethylase Trm1